MFCSSMKNVDFLQYEATLFMWILDPTSLFCIDEELFREHSNIATREL